MQDYFKKGGYKPRQSYGPKRRSFKGKKKVHLSNRHRLFGYYFSIEVVGSRINDYRFIISYNGDDYGPYKRASETVGSALADAARFCLDGFFENARVRNGRKQIEQLCKDIRHDWAQNQDYY